MGAANRWTARMRSSNFQHFRLANMRCFENIREDVAGRSDVTCCLVHGHVDLQGKPGDTKV